MSHSETPGVKAATYEGVGDTSQLITMSNQRAEWLCALGKGIQGVMGAQSETPRLGEVDWTVEMALDLGRKNFASNCVPG